MAVESVKELAVYKKGYALAMRLIQVSVMLRSMINYPDAVLLP